MTDLGRVLEFIYTNRPRYLNDNAVFRKGDIQINLIQHMGDEIYWVVYFKRLQGNSSIPINYHYDGQVPDSALDEDFEYLVRDILRVGYRYVGYMDVSDPLSHNRFLIRYE